MNDGEVVRPTDDCNPEGRDEGSSAFGPPGACVAGGTVGVGATLTVATLGPVGRSGDDASDEGVTLNAKTLGLRDDSVAVGDGEKDGTPLTGAVLVVVTDTGDGEKPVGNGVVGAAACGAFGALDDGKSVGAALVVATDAKGGFVDEGAVVAPGNDGEEEGTIPISAVLTGTSDGEMLVGVVGAAAFETVEDSVAVGFLDNIESVGASVMDASDGEEVAVNEGVIVVPNDDGE
jgi:hypothetical protein